MNALNTPQTANDGSNLTAGKQAAQAPNAGLPKEPSQQNQKMKNFAPTALSQIQQTTSVAADTTTPNVNSSNPYARNTQGAVHGSGYATNGYNDSQGNNPAASSHQYVPQQHLPNQFGNQRSGYKPAYKDGYGQNRNVETQGSYKPNSYGQRTSNQYGSNNYDQNRSYDYYTTAGQTYDISANRLRNNFSETNHYGQPNMVDDSFQTVSDRQSMFFDACYDYNTATNASVGYGGFTGGAQDGMNMGGMSSALQQVEQELFGTERHITAGIDFDKYDDIPVECSGKDVPPAIEKFEDANFCQPLLENLKRVNYTKPTPIQKNAIPIGLKGRDIMACAQTGSGKTAAFLFPMINYIITNGNNTGKFTYDDGELPSPLGLVLAPTRELASQIYEEALRFTYRARVHCVVVYGGAGIQRQVGELNKRQTAIVVATPGRLVDLKERGNISFSKLKFLVLDEADRMLDMGFEPQIRKIVEQFDMPQQKSRQTAMFSATFPQNIQQLAADFMGDYIFVTVGRVGGTTSSITQNLLYVDDIQKKAKLFELLNQIPGLTLVFVETKRAADTLHNELYRHQKIACTSIHGDRTQKEREKALWEFSSGKCTVMIATDVASRGLDIPNVAHVINFDLPNDIDSYVHRIGRTGRAGNKGIASSFMNEKNNKLAKDLISVLQDAEQQVPVWLNNLEVNSSTKPANRYNSSGGGNRGGSHNKFGGRDFRSAYNKPQIYQHNSQPQYAGATGGGYGHQQNRNPAQTMYANENTGYGLNKAQAFVQPNQGYGVNVMNGGYGAANKPIYPTVGYAYTPDVNAPRAYGHQQFVNNQPSANPEVGGGFKGASRGGRGGHQGYGEAW